jgi:hypothetical protein
VAVSSDHPYRIVWVRGPYFGPTSDVTVVLRGGLLKRLKRNERILADPAYQSHYRFITRINSPSSPQDRLFNFKLSQRRIVSEHMYHRIKIFNCLRQPWRGDLGRHRLVFTVICQITNVELNFRPLHRQ